MKLNPLSFMRGTKSNVRIAIIINAYYSAPYYLSQSLRIKEELENLGATAEIIRNNGYYSIVDEGEIKTVFSAYDACVYLDKDKYLSQMLEKIGIRIFNSHDTIQACDDKMTTHIALTGVGLNMPKTLPGILCYDAFEPIREESVIKIERELGYPLVIKESYGSQGKSVYLINNRNDLLAVLQNVKMKPHLLQRAILSSMGKDVRVIVIGGKAIGAMLRRGGDGFHSNIGQGGSGSVYPLSPSFKEAATEAARTLNADYCGVDILFGETGEPIVCEVNSNAFFSEFEKCTKINVAAYYAKYILKNV